MFPFVNLPSFQKKTIKLFPQPERRGTSLEIRRLLLVMGENGMSIII